MIGSAQGRDPEVSAGGRARRMLSGMAWLSGATLVQYASALAAMSLLARLLEPAHFGLVALAASLLNLTRLLSEMGMAPALIRRREISPDHVAVAFTSIMAFSLAAASGLVLGSGALARALEAPQLAPMLLLVAALVPLNAAASVAGALLSRRHAFRSLALSDLPGSLLGSALLSVVLAWLGLGAWAILIGLAVQQASAALIRIALAPDCLRIGWRLSVFQELWAFSAAQTLAAGLNYLAMNGDNFVVGKLMGLGPLGLYNRAFRLMMIPVEVVATAAQRVLFPMLSDLQDDPDRYRSAYLGGLSALFAVLMPAAVFLVFVADPLIRLVLGPGWTEATPVAQVLFLFLAFRCVGRQVNVPVMISARPRTLVLIYSAYAAAVLVGSAVAAAVGDLRLVAVAVGLAQLVQYALAARAANRIVEVRLRSWLAAHVPGLAAAGVVALTMIPITWGARVIVAPSPAGGLIQLVLLPIAAATTLAIAWLAAPRLFLGARAARLLLPLVRGWPLVEGRLRAAAG